MISPAELRIPWDLDLQTPGSGGSRWEVAINGKKTGRQMPAHDHD